MSQLITIGDMVATFRNNFRRRIEASLEEYSVKLNTKQFGKVMYKLNF